ncbi:MAG: iron-sulfur cluster repair di-iron protein, ric [Atopostipes suicloacalis]|nr:iron-sulfur cluster repair di-iron protein, ric [Atopostipes suicloacalis]MDN6730935.1 iron-sulfur cluster repair di-iron protein, ric [Atopostipes suicloacalis]
MTNTRFEEVKTEHIEKLEQFTPIVERVHGENHPEFLKVHQLFNQLNGKIKANEQGQVDLNEEFKALRKVTSHYKVPNDVCESYEAVYHMLESLDQAYQAE